jgi:hypothetical protein
MPAAPRSPHLPKRPYPVVLVRQVAYSALVVLVLLRRIRLRVTRWLQRRSGSP